jgi:6-phosphogluconolactonase (cycloisomerase 2 family)
VGGNGVLTPQETFYTQGLNPFRLIADAPGDYLYVLDHDSPSAAACSLALGAGVKTCADITAFQINATTGRLQLVVNAQVTAANGAALPYFPVPANPIDFSLSSGYILTLSGTPATGDSVFPYTYNQATGQLSINQNTSQPLGIGEATAIVNGSSFVYVLDNEGTLVQAAEPGATSQILSFSVGNNGALQAETGSVVADDPTLNNPIYLIVESKGKFAYVINQGNNTQGTNAQSGLAGYVLDPTTHQLSFIAGEPFGSGAGPQCLVEDPSDQFVYSADFNDSAVTGRVVDPNSGVLNQMRVTSTFSLGGPATWCLVDGRTS